MKKLMKKLFVITPILMAAALVATFLPNFLTFADSDDLKGSNDSAVVRTSERQSGRISREEAERIALNEVNGTIVDFDLDDDEFEIEVILNGIEYDLEIDAFTGHVLEVEIDDESDDDHHIDKKDHSARISSEEARQIALAKVNGTIVDFELDDNEYEIEVILDGIEYDLEIDAFTGEITEFDVD